MQVDEVVVVVALSLMVSILLLGSEVAYSQMLFLKAMVLMGLMKTMVDAEMLLGGKL